MSAPEDELAWQLKAVGIPFVREVVFAPPRKFRADFVLDHCDHPHSFSEGCRFIVEVDGGAFSGGRHTTGAGFRRDLEKFNVAALEGWRVLRFLPEQVSDGSALRTIEAALGSAPSPTTGGPGAPR